MKGIRIKQLRESMGLTQSELATKLKISSSAVAMYETDKREPSDEIKLKMCDLFNCSMDYLIGKSELKNKIEIDVPKMLSEYKDYIKHSSMPYLDYNLLTDNEKNILFEMFTDFANTVNGKANIHPLSYYKNQVTDDFLWKNILGIYIVYTKYVYDVFSEIKEKISDTSVFDNVHIDDSIAQENSKIYMAPIYGQISAGIPNWAEECIEGRLPIDPSLMDIVNPEECFFLRVNGESMNKVISNGAYALIRKTDWVENGEIAVVLVNGYDATLKKFTKQNDVIVLEPMSNDSTFQVQIYDKSTPIKVIGKYIGKFEIN